MAKLFPVVGEIFTAVESGVLITAAGVAKVFDNDEAAEELARASGNAWKEYSETNMIAAPVNAGIHDLILEDKKKAREIERKIINGFEGLIDSTPVVGHVKACYHASKGDHEKSDKVWESSTRATLVLGAGALTGGLGAGVAYGALAGVATGTAFDGATTLMDEDGGNRGIWGFTDPGKNPNDVFQAMITPVGDGLSGAAGNNMGKKIRSQCTKAGRAQNNLTENYKKEGVPNAKKATKSTMKAAEKSKETHQALPKKDQVTTSHVEDSSSGKSGVGHNGRTRSQLSKLSKNPKENVDSNKTSLQRRQPEVKPDPSVKWDQKQCAEPDAFNNLESKAPKYKESKAKVSTVRTDKKTGQVTTIPRCGNCKAFNMGTVYTDLIPKGTPVPTCGYTNPGSLRVGCLCGGAGLALADKKKHRVYFPPKVII